MATRADFYVGRGASAQWLGSVALDGYPPGISPKDGSWPDGESLFDAQTEEEYRARLERYFLYRTDVSRPEDGWPWPWNDSHTTDYAYTFDDGTVFVSPFGRRWMNIKLFVDSDEDWGELPKDEVFPDMSSKKRVTLGPRSGLIVI